MNIVLTGSLGNIGKPLTKELVKKEHSVTVISSSADREKDIEALGATAAIGTMQDVAFLASTFKGADVAYLMETLDRSAFADPNLDIVEAIAQIGRNYKEALEQSGVKKVILLSSVGAHMDTGNGNLRFHYEVEKILNGLPADVAIKVMRPPSFFVNLLRSIPAIKEHGAIISNHGGDKKEPWVSPLDIAAAIAEEVELPFAGRTVRYVASDEVSPNEVAKALGEAIGMPELKWQVISDEQLQNGMIASGMSPQVAKGFVEMLASQGSGVLYEDYYRHKPVLGKVKLAHFAKEFASLYTK